VETEVAHVLRQRRRGLVSRIEDELLSARGLAPRMREVQQRRITEAVRSAVANAKPTLTVCLCPEMLPSRAVEIVASASPVCWWFADDPFHLERRTLRGPPVALESAQRPDSIALVAHPRWARGPLESAIFLPYAGRFEPRRPAYSCPGPRPYECVVVGSPRAERAELLTTLDPLLGPALHVWGWGVRGRLPTNRRTRAFRRRLRGWGVLGPEATKRVYRSARVILNLQDIQMLETWNPQTFDLMGLGVPQVVWNSSPVSYLESPPPYAQSADGLAELVLAQLAITEPSAQVEEAFAEARRRHRWRHRAASIAELF